MPHLEFWKYIIDQPLSHINFTTKKTEKQPPPSSPRPSIYPNLLKKCKQNPPCLMASTTFYNTVLVQQFKCLTVRGISSDLPTSENSVRTRCLKAENRCCIVVWCTGILRKWENWSLDRPDSVITSTRVIAEETCRARPPLITTTQKQ